MAWSRSLFELTSAFLAISNMQVAQAAYSRCKSTPNDQGWPTTADWAAFNSSISGKLIKTVPVAAPCYEGESANVAQCEIVKVGYGDISFRSNFPLGYAYPHTDTCQLPGGNTTTCSIGDWPVYAINTTTSNAVAAGVNFAREKNLRLVIKMTGHDQSGRSTGHGSLEIWLHHLRQGFNLEETYQPSKACEANYWNGSSLEIKGGYSWVDTYAAAAAYDVIVVGGGCPGVGSIGGYIQGGGHSAATHDYGMGSDSLLEAQVVLADGRQVLASPCENPDLFTSLRGGGPGTYGIITSAKVKAHPNTHVAAVLLSMAPKTTSAADLAAFMEALAGVYESLPSLGDAGLSGYGIWAARGPVPIIENSTTGLTLAFGRLGGSTAEVQTIFAQTAAKLQVYNTTNLEIKIDYIPFDSYWEYHNSTHGQSSGAASLATASRLFTKDNLNNGAALRSMLKVMVGGPDEPALHGFGLFGGGVLGMVPDPLSGVNPAWRKAYVFHYTMRVWADTAEFSTVKAVHHDITSVKGAALAAFAPDTGTYMNEADWQDPDYLKNFYGSALETHEAAKKKYDADGVFYCHTCVGSNQWEIKDDGHLCRVEDI